MKRPEKPIKICGAEMFGGLVLDDPRPAHKKSLTPRQRETVELLAEGPPPKETADVLKAAPRRMAFHCSLPRGHQGPHMLLNPTTAPQEFSPEEIEAMQRKIAEISPRQMAAQRRKMANDIWQMLSGQGLIVLTVDEGADLLPGEGSQPACGYQPAGPPAIRPCALPRNHKLPHVCRRAKGPMSC